MREILGALKRNLAAGLLVLVPAGVTLWVFLKLVNWIDRPLRQWLQAYDVGGMPGAGILVTLAGIYLVGLLARTLAGRTLIRVGEWLLERVPLLGTVYSALKQVLETVLSGSSGAFRKAVLIEYPRRGLWSVAFLTGSVPAAVRPAVSEGEAAQPGEVFCFVPTTPNPTSGVLVLVSQDQIRPLDLSVEQAVKLVISGGILTPGEARAANLGRASEKG